MTSASGGEEPQYKFEFYNAQFEFKFEDFWIGVFWRRIGNAWDLWCCLIPCFPLHISWGWHDTRQ